MDAAVAIYKRIQKRNPGATGEDYPLLEQKNRYSSPHHPAPVQSPPRRHRAEA